MVCIKFSKELIRSLGNINGFVITYIVNRFNFGILLHNNSRIQNFGSVTIGTPTDHQERSYTSSMHKWAQGRDSVMHTKHVRTGQNCDPELLLQFFSYIYNLQCYRRQLVTQWRDSVRVNWMALQAAPRSLGSITALRCTQICNTVEVTPNEIMKTGDL